MDLALAGKIVLITGGSKGIGLACARAFFVEGATIALSSRSRDNIDRACSELKSVAYVNSSVAPKSAYGIAGDLADPDQAVAAIDAVERDLGPIDILVNSAGAAKRRPPDELTPALWRAAMDAKYFSYINVIDPMIKRMAARGSGVIVNVIGNGGKVASPLHLAGGAANAALMLATAGLAAAYASKGVRVVAVNPGVTKTERMVEGLKADARLSGLSIEESEQRMTSGIPMGRIAEPEEVANAVVFLASSAASYINGVNITMDGGQFPVIL